MLTIKPPSPIIKQDLPRPWLFLSGSIEMGTAERWQDLIGPDLTGVDGTIFNPRRDDWDSSWKQSIEDIRFREQVEWELRGLEGADIIFVHFAPGTMSPITLLELGLFARDQGQDMIVSCPDGFWRRGNVEIVCKRYGVEFFGDFWEALSRLQRRLLTGR